MTYEERLKEFQSNIDKAIHNLMKIRNISVIPDLDIISHHFNYICNGIEETVEVILKDQRKLNG